MQVSLIQDSKNESNGLAVPSYQNHRECNEKALQLTLGSGRYPENLGIEGPQYRMDLIIIP